MTAPDPYDQFSYESIAFPDTHPRHLAVLGRLFELQTADPDDCRVLELGCATGGNLIPMAWYQPGARFLGIDLSGRQIARGREMIAGLGLKNIELRQGDIQDLGEDLGGFDYIIAHGVYSWVPLPVREQLLRLSRLLLNPHGLLYLSFNTLPGWRMRGMLRDILCYACRGIEQPQPRLEAAYAALARLDTALGDLQALSARYLREEIRYLHTAHPSYLLFEYLAGENNAFLFSDFLADIRSQGLDYLCDTELSSLFPSTFGEATEKGLEEIEDDMDLEQWLDFVSNRNFRCSVLCRDDAAPADELSLDAFAACAFGSELIPPPKVDLRHRKASGFRQPDGTRVEVEQPLTKAILLEMGNRQPDLVPLDQLLPAAHQRLIQGGGERFAAEYDSCLMELFTLFSHRLLSAAPAPQRFHRGGEQAPSATPLARAQLAAGHAQLATARHTSLDLDSFAAHLIRYLDGRHSTQQISELITRDLRSGALAPPPELKIDNWPIEKLGNRVARNCLELVDLFSRQGILLPGD